MRRFTVLLTMFVLAVGLIVSLAPLTAVADDKDQCKDGGWATLRDAAGQPFKNQGQCVRYAAQGGVFAPVGSIDLALALATGEAGGSGQCIAYTITGSGLAPDTAVTVTFTLLGSSPETSTNPVPDNGTVFIQSGKAGVGFFLCGEVTALAVSALAADGTTVTDTAPLPC